MAFDPTDPLGEVSKAFLVFGDVLKSNLIPPLESVRNAIQVMGLGDFATALSSIGESIAGIVKLADPALFDRFTVVLRDLWAVVGRALAPLLETVVMPMMRMLADALTELEPVGAALALALQPLIEVFGMFADALAEGLKLVAKVLVEVVPFVVAFARVVGDLVRQIGHWIRELLAFIGIELGDELGRKKGASVGAAAKQAQITDFLSAIGRAQVSAFSLGRPGDDMPATVTAMKSRVDEICGVLSGIPDRIGAFILDLPRRIADALSGALTVKGAPLSDAIVPAVAGAAAFRARADLMATFPVTGFAARTIGRLYPGGYPTGD